MPHFPPPQIPPPMKRFQRVPPAIFQPILGVLGLVTAWGLAVRVFALPSALIELASGMACFLFAVCTLAYVGKILRRPRVVIEDCATLPGRTGIAAWCISMLVLAGILVAYSVPLALVCLAIGGTCLLILAVTVLILRLQGRDTTGPMTPAMHLIFVAFILIPGATTAMNMRSAAIDWLVWYCLAAGVLITAKTIRPLLFAEGAPPMRPLQTIQLAPASFCAIAAFHTGQHVMAGICLVWAGVVLALLIWRVRWLTEGPFTPFWSAFTFPVTALISAGLMGYEAFNLEFLRILGGLILIAATLYIPVIAYRVLKLWSTGVLAVKSNAAIA